MGAADWQVCKLVGVVVHSWIRGRHVLHTNGSLIPGGARNHVTSAEGLGLVSDTALWAQEAVGQITRQQCSGGFTMYTGESYPDSHNEGCFGIEAAGTPNERFTLRWCLDIGEHCRVCPGHRDYIAQQRLNLTAYAYTPAACSVGSNQRVETRDCST